MGGGRGGPGVWRCGSGSGLGHLLSHEPLGEARGSSSPSWRTGWQHWLPGTEGTAGAELKELEGQPWHTGVPSSHGKAGAPRTSAACPAWPERWGAGLIPCPALPSPCSQSGSFLCFRKFRPCHHQFKSFPEISFLGPKDASPFEAPRTPGGSQHPRPREPSPRSAARPVPRRKKGYCECCQEAFHELHVHLQSAQHQGFALEAHPYAEVDRIIAQLSHSLADIPFRACLPRRSGGPASVGDPLCAETLPHSEPSHPRATPPMKRSDTCQAPGAPQQAVTVGGVQAPSEPAGTGEASGPGASCQEPEGSLEVFVDPAGTATSRSPACQRPRTNPGVTDLSSGSDSAAVGHKRKVQFPSGSAEKRPGASWPEASFFVPRAPNPGSSRTASGDHLLPLPPPSQEPRSPAAVLPTSCPQACLSFPDPFPWQPTGVWATQPPWPGGGWPPGPADSEQAAPGPVSQRDEPAVPGQLSAAGPRIPGGPAESQSASAPHPLPAGGAASCSRWFWTSPPLQVPCLPVSQAGPQPSAGPELLL